MGCTLFQRILALWERFEKAVENERFKVLHVFLALYEPNFRKAREGFLWSPGYRLCLSFQLITTTDGKKVSAACPHHWGRGACWGSFSDVSIPKKSTLYTSCTDQENGCRFGPDLDGLCPYVCSKPRPTMLPVSCFKLFSSVASCTPKNNHHQCHMVSKIKDPSFEYISSWLYFKCLKYVSTDGEHGALKR